MEGSTLGGLYISKMIAKQLNLTNGAFLSFFDGYGEQTEEMWNSFKSALDEQVVHTAEQAAVVQAANDTFKKFKTWIALSTAS